MGLVTRHRGVNFARPGFDAAGGRLGMVEALATKPHGDVERACAMVAEDDEGSVAIELSVSTARDVAHRHEEGVGQVGGVVLPLFAHVEHGGRLGLAAQCGEFGRGDFW